MRFAKLIRIGILVAGLCAAIPSGATDLPPNQDEGGRQVTIKPISQSGLGGEGGHEWLLTGWIAGTVLLGLGGLVAAKVIQ